MTCSASPRFSQIVFISLRSIPSKERRSDCQKFSLRSLASVILRWFWDICLLFWLSKKIPKFFRAVFDVNFFFSNCRNKNILKKVKYQNLVSKGPTKPSGFYSAVVQRVIFWEWFFTDHWSSFLSPLWSRLKGLSNWLEMGQSDQLDTNEIFWPSAGRLKQGHKLTLFVSVLMATGQHTLAKVLASNLQRQRWYGHVQG